LKFPGIPIVFCHHLESSGSIKIAGSMYNLETGVVEFLA
jgi:hypothetical protein